MKTPQKTLWAVGLFLLAGLAWLVRLPTGPTVGQTRTFDLSARRYAFEPAILEVQRGNVVTLRLEAVDTVHGFYLDGYDLRMQAEPGKSAQLTFTADRVGKFKFRCAITCGNLHPFMIGELRVRPNLPFVHAIASLILVIAGGLVWFWPGKEASDGAS